MDNTDDYYRHEDYCARYDKDGFATYEGGKITTTYPLGMQVDD
jgi:hypothetical protein